MNGKTMKSLKFSLPRASALFLVTSLLCGGAFAEKPEWAGGGKGQKHGQKHEQKHEQEQSGSQSQGARTDIRVGAYFGDQQRLAVRDYYSEQSRAGKCPPGLAKKNNGCMPPGQAKKWSVGQPLARDVVFYPVPQTISVRLGVPPSGYRYVRVASDILLIAVGTSMVIDAIQDLGAL
jgi:Ni/Co efflux regulator RcnB